MEVAGFTIRTVADEPGLRNIMPAMIAAAWPKYVLQSRNAFRDMLYDWDAIYDRWPEFQFCLFEPGSDMPCACGNSLALAWDGPVHTLPARGWTWAMHSGEADHAQGRMPNTHCALGISILPEAQGRGLSAAAVTAMKALGRQAGLHRLVAPVRPSHKSRYPLTTIYDYAQWKTSEGLPFDPWVRVHHRLGAHMVSVCDESMGMMGTVADWTEWSGLRFPVSGLYAVPDCLAPVSIDLDQDCGVYIEPNIWMVHEYSETT